MLIARFDLIQASRLSVDYCQAQDIDWSAAVAHAGGVFLVEAQQSGRFFDPAPGGELMAWVEALAEDAATPIDCVAWPLERPDCVLTLGGVAPALGLSMAANEATYMLGAALCLHRRPVDWLRSGCNGAVILDRAAGARWLLDLPPGRWAAEDKSHAAEIVASMEELIDRGRIVVPRQPRAA